MQPRRSFEAQLTLLNVFTSLPLYLLLLWALLSGDTSRWLTAFIALIGAITILFSSYRIYQKADYQFRSLGNLLDAMIQGDYSMRARSGRSDGALDDLVRSINALADRLNQQRAESVESQRLVRTVIDHIDVAILALSDRKELRFVNPAAIKLLQLSDETLSQTLLDQLAAVQQQPSGSHQVMELSLGKNQGRFNVHIESFHEAGVENKLLFITDVRTLLRSEERKAWQSLVRVISHEINNSLAPIASISQTLCKTAANSTSLNTSLNSTDITEGLTLIHQRAKGLIAFVESYRQLAQLPEPKKQWVAVIPLIQKCILLFPDHTINLISENEPTDAINANIDPVLMEQVLINLIKNATEAAPTGLIKIHCALTQQSAPENRLLCISVCDTGPGIANTENIFVPFYSTKKDGTGIGLALSRQIIESHGGQLFLTNTTNPNGCQASIELPTLP